MWKMLQNFVMMSFFPTFVKTNRIIMRRYIFSTAMAAVMALLTALPSQALDYRVKVFENTVFYDGWLGDVVDKEKEDGITRHSNYLYMRPLTQLELYQMKTQLELTVKIGALCDNYDRQGSVNLALVPKGRTSYSPYDDADVKRIEVARFITPFMNKNRTPDAVTYKYRIDDLALILNDKSLRETYDFWVELEVFGIPYAANKQVKGCADRNDVFAGSVTLDSGGETPGTDGHRFMPVAICRSEYFGNKNFNNYTPEACDTLGVATRTWEFEATDDLSDSKLTLITSNHGANEGGEEYNRRLHLIYLDGELIASYIPGEATCEPYRKYNTQRNGIYGDVVMPDEEWQEFSNWCPGAAIPTRELHTGALKAGVHKLMIRVPEAEFVDGQGDFRVSAYVQGVTDGARWTSITEVTGGTDEFDVTVSGGRVLFGGNVGLTEARLYSASGELVGGTFEPASGISTAGLAPGVYIAAGFDHEGHGMTRKIMIH